jgi:hypothetical protein
LSLSGDQLKALARQGAAQRYQELQAELAALKATFPELGRAGGRAKASAPAASRRHRTMNAAQRKEVSERMSRYWAARRAEKAGGDGAGAGKGKGRKRKSAKKAAE